MGRYIQILLGDDSCGGGDPADSESGRSGARSEDAKEHSSYGGRKEIYRDSHRIDEYDSAARRAKNMYIGGKS